MIDPTAAPIRVLLADDTATVRLLLRRTLESSPAFEVVGEASDGGQAVDMAEALQPDMVVLDMAMPVMGGLEAIPRIRLCAPRSRIVVLSGFAPASMGDQALGVGAAAYLDKQQRPDELVAGLLQAWRSRAGGTDEQAGAGAPPAPDHLARALDHSPGGMAMVDDDDRLVYANAALARMSGYSAQELRRFTLPELAFVDDQEAAAAARKAVLAGEEAVPPVEARLLRRDGRKVWVLVARSMVPDGGAGAGGAAGGRQVVQLTDISEQKRIQAELARSNAELGSFAFLAAHELKSPIQAVSGFAALLSQVHGAALDPQAREFIGWIVDGAARMDALIEDLLAYCSADTAESVLTDVALDEILAAALSALEGDVAARRAVVDTEPLPVVLGDPFQLGQLVQNLLANALKFVPDGQAPHVQVSAERTNQGWLVTVADNGIGVEDASSDRIFAMFERLHPRERYKGTGIGLSICKRIVERRGGAIWVEHNQPRGSRFRFSVPDTAPALASRSVA